jgi:hypothetical protein
MAYRYLFYSTGTTYASTVVRESASSTPLAGEKSFYTDFMIPEIQPLYLWRVDNLTVPTTLLPNTDSNVNAYELAVSPPPTSDDLVTYGELTGSTANKIDKVSGANTKIPVFNSAGNLLSSGYSVPQLTGLTTYTFVGSGGTQVIQTGNNIKIYSTPPTGATVLWGNIAGNINLQTDLQTEFNTKLNKSIFNTYTGTTAPATYVNKTQYNIYTGATASAIDLKLDKSVFNSYTGTTVPATYLSKSAFNIYSGTTVPATYVNKTQYNIYTGATASAIGLKLDKSVFNTYTGTTAPATYLSKSAFNIYSGTTVPANYYNKTQINSYTGATAILIGTKITKVGSAVLNDIPTLLADGSIADSGKQFITLVNTVATATDTKVPTELAVRNAINQAVAGAIILQGDWNATTNTPNISATTTTGFAWRVSVSGTTNLGGITSWAVGDLAVKVAGTPTWMKIDNEDIAAVWGNISGTLSNQTDLQAALNAKVNGTTFNLYTGTTAPATYLSKSAFNTYSGTTVPANYYNKTQINAYTGATAAQINSKLPTSTFTGYTASTKNINKKIQVVSTLTSNANQVVPFEVTWNSANPYATDMYTWSGGSGVFIRSAGTYEVQYHVLLKNDNANQTHSVGAYVLVNGVSSLLTASAGMIVGSNASGELSLPPVVLTLGLNNRLDLALFRIGSAGNANLVTGSVFLTLNKLS